MPPSMHLYMISLDPEAANPELGVMLFTDTTPGTVKVPAEQIEAAAAALQKHGFTPTVITEDGERHIDVTLPVLPADQLVITTRTALAGILDVPRHVYWYEWETNSHRTGTLLFYDLDPETHRELVIRPELIAHYLLHTRKATWAAYAQTVAASGLCAEARLEEDKNLRVFFTEDQAQQHLATWLLIAQLFPQD